MSDLVLSSVKESLGLQSDDDSFNGELLIFINSSLGVVSQLGVGVTFVTITNETDWGSLEIPDDQLAMVKPLVALKTRLLFDPPSTGYVLDAYEREIKQLEARVSMLREGALNG